MKNLIYLFFSLGLYLTFLVNGMVFANDQSNHDILIEIGERVNSPNSKYLTKNNLLEIEAALSDVVQVDKDNEQGLLAQAYLIDIYSRLAGISRTVENKEFFSRKTDIAFERLVQVSPEYSLAYANYAVSLFSAPDFLELHKKAQENFENALRFIPANLAARQDEDWTALAITAQFYPKLLNKPQLLGMTENEAEKRKSEVNRLANALKKE